MKKKILSLVLVVAMLTSMLVFAPVSGATTADGTVEVTNASGYAGETVAVDVVLKTTSPVYKYQFAFDYDKSMMTLDKVDLPAGSGFWPVFGDAAIDAVMAESPYDNFGWNRAVGADPMNASEGAVIATMYFTLNADALGGAYVSVVASPINNIAIDGGQPGDKIYNFEYVAGSVNALPAGYIDPSAGNPADFVVTNIGGKLTEYKGSSKGTLVIPAQAYNDKGALKNVKVLESELFCYSEFTTLILPENVTQLNEGAIYDPAVDELKIVVLNSNVTFNEASVYIEESTCNVIICGYAGSTAEAYAQSAGYDFEALDLCSLAAGDTSYLVPAGTEISAPGMTEIDGKLVIGWSDGAKTYAPGATMAPLTGDTTLAPVTIEAPKMNAGVGFQPTASLATTKMRYTTKMAIADYEALAALGTVQVGTIITPAAYVSQAGGLTKEALNALGEANPDKCQPNENGDYAGVTYIDVVAKGYLTADETHYTFAGSLSNFKADNIDLEYAAAFYVTVTLADNSSFTIYTDFDLGANRTVGATIDAAVGINGFTEQQAADIKALIAANK